MTTKRKIETKIETEDTTEEILDINEPLFDGGPLLSQVEEWKGLYGQVYFTEFEDGDVFLFRALNRKEFKDIMSIESADALYREERVCERCVIWPEDYNFLSMTTGKAGVPSLISEQVMEMSGFASKVGPIML